MNKYLEKIAKLSNEAKKDIAGTATIGALGAGTGVAANHLLHNTGLFKKPGWKTTALVSGGLGLAADYAALKINKHINKRIDKK